MQEMQQSNNPTTNTLFYSGSSSTSSRLICTPSPFAHSLLYLQEVGSLKAIHPHVSERKGLASYLMFVVVSGWLEYKGERYELEAGDCVFLSCKDGYKQSSSKTLWALSWVRMNGPSMPAIWNKYCERDGKPVFKPTDHPDGTSGASVYIKLLNDLYTTASSSSFIRDVEINTLLSELIGLLFAETVYEEHEKPVPISTGSTTSIDVSAIKSYIDTHYNTPLSLELLSDHFHFNKNYVSRRFKETFGMTVNGYIALVRTGRAKELLRFTGKSIEEISYECGYGGESNYFSRVFKKVEGCSLSEFRRNWMSRSSESRSSEEEK